jgi:uncharacterized protein with FMN-binding domain
VGCALGSFVAAIGCTPVSAVGGPVDSQRLRDGVFQGSAAHIDKATVHLLVQNQRIAKVTLVAFNASPMGKKAREPIPRRIVEQQSTKVDVVAGATEASNIIMNAVDDAVRKSYAQAK